MKHISQEKKEAVIESELDCEQSNADSGATPIRSAIAHLIKTKMKKMKKLTW